ncbi:unnamed protein product [Ceutorhynchus assimilis]|uniref:Uncharacterized protein n=1 Tax=Ceutorhynchus assimilis TaxID=467358 RepID=A0A9N9QQS9_9CUCU|nr:unnamed protein product [Ceutorhynchus assimilis]
MQNIENKRLALGRSFYHQFQLCLARKHTFQLWPAAVVGQAGLIAGLKVYFFRSKAICEIPRHNVLMSFDNLIGQKVSFRRQGGFKRGILMDYVMDQTTMMPVFYVECEKKAIFAVAFFDLFLTSKQADRVLPEMYSTTSLLSW